MASKIIIVVDYYSDFREIEKLSGTKSENIKNFIKKQFSRYGVPKILITDNGPQFTTSHF